MKEARRREFKQKDHASLATLGGRLGEPLVLPVVSIVLVRVCVW